MNVSKLVERAAETAIEHRRVAIALAAVLTAASVAAVVHDPAPSAPAASAAQVIPTEVREAPADDLPASEAGERSPTATPTPTSSPRAPEDPDRAVSLPALRFTRAWLAGRDMDRNDWLEKLQSLTTDELITGLTWTDTATLPKTSIPTPAAPVVRSHGASVAIVDVPLADKTTVIRVGLISSGKAWLVNDVELVPPGAPVPTGTPEAGM